MLPVVGIGASAGGLEALDAFFSNLPGETGFAFIVTTHQPPDHVSLLPELLTKFTTMPVLTAQDGMALEKNHIFVCPPGKNLGLLKRCLHLVESTKFQAANLPIDYFLRSLAADIQEMAVGIILSGTGTDGSLGLKAIKGAAGMTMVQDPRTAKFDGMPQSAIAMGDVDFVLPPEKMGQQLIEYSRSPYFSRIHAVAGELLTVTEPLKKIFILLRNQTGQDFSAYKPSTINRRIARRMNIHQVKNINDYVQFLQENPIEITKLFNELLINVTGFFRDAAAFQALNELALPRLFENKPDNYEFRVWVAGCSSGEEAYSIAILFKEYMQKISKLFRFQMFATDLDISAINRAREGLYPIGIAADVSPERLHRFFTLEDDHYRIGKEIRDTAIFALQNLLRDPPFTRVDLISCRNVLIYLNAESQKGVFPQFHYALNPGGILFLGSSESVGSFDNLFSTLDKKWKIYQRTEASAKLPTFNLNIQATALPQLPLKTLTSDSQSGLIVRQIELLLLEQYAPVCVIINEYGKILYIHGRTGHYLEPAPGQPEWNIFEMAREGLRIPLMASLRKFAKTEEMEILNPNINVKTNGDFELIDLKLTKIFEPEALRDLVLVSFHPHKKKAPVLAPVKQRAAPVTRDKNEGTTKLEEELYFVKESLRATIEKLQTSNEEIKSTNEELQSTNEELQSSNEELETSKEEMQSLNEELITVNNELQNKVEALSQINDDMQNLLNSTHIATIYLDNHLCIRRYTQQAKAIFKLIDSDIGRPLGDLASTLKYDRLIDDAKSVLQTLAYKDTEVQTVNGDWYLLRILPYRTAENMIDGLVITFIDITRLKKAEQAVLDADLMTAIVNTVHQPLLVLNDELNIIAANPAFRQLFKVEDKDIAGQAFFSINAAIWDSASLRAYLTKALVSNTVFDGLDYEADFPLIGKKRLLINACNLKQAHGKPVFILVAIDDMTERGTPL